MHLLSWILYNVPIIANLTRKECGKVKHHLERLSRSDMIPPQGFYPGIHLADEDECQGHQMNL